VIEENEGLACLLSLSPLCTMKKMWRKVKGLSSLLNLVDFVIRGFIAWMFLLLHANIHFTHSLVEILLHAIVVCN
jgi:hypothetical protein